MATTKCRVCGNKFFAEPLLRYENMPRGAQYLPDAKSLESDKGVDLEVWQCSGCGLVQLSNDPVPYYREVIRAAAFSPEMIDFRRKQFGSFAEEYFLKGKKVIEIGCGRGEYLSLMQACGVKAYGLEYSAESAAQCVKNGLKVSKGFIQNSTDRLNDAPFDAFFILNYLEHLPEPNSALAGIYNNSADNAVGLVEVPNFDMILRNNLFSEFIGDHLFYFTKDTLAAALKLSGFEIINCNVVWHDYIISAVVKKSHSTPPGQGLHSLVTSGKLDLSRFYKHQALAIISLLKLAGKIKYVVDSAPFKQGKYTPATHIAIVSPDALNSDPVDAIIIMAASYSDEVAGIIRKKYDKKVNISILRDYGLEIVR